MLTFKTKIQGPIAVIGDLHGQSDKLRVILNRLGQLPEFQHRWVVFIGDFVDRGPDPKKTIQMVLEFAEAHPRTTAVMGNHEFAMCSALGWLPGNDGTVWGQRWVSHYSPQSTFESYGAAVGDLEGLAARVPAAHRDFLVNLPWCVEHPQLLFVHAGLDPNIPFNVQLRILQQKDFSLTRPQWLCEKSFVDADPPADCPATLVSGHVKVDEVVIRPRRILVDTTGGEEGDLSCVLMPERRVISSSLVEQSSARPEPKRQATAASGSSAWWKIWA